MTQTRTRLLETAERLFAEHGMSVSNRQIGEAAGQGNNSVVGYHFGTKNELAYAIVRAHEPDIERRRRELLAHLKGKPTLADWLTIVVRPITDHLDALGTPSFYARFLAQVASSPDLGPVLHDATLAAPSMRAPYKGLASVIGRMPKEVFAERAEMTRHIVVNVCAERERALHLGLPTPRKTWAQATDGIVDALVGLLKAPVRTPKEKHR